MKHLLFLLCAMALMQACKKSSESKTPDPGPQGEPIVTTQAANSGAVISAEIGPAGGTLQSEDGLVNVNIPAGAVATNTTFGIQALKAALNPLSGKDSYRIFPQEIEFTKPVIITFKYDDANDDVLQIAWQDVNGQWRNAPAALNKTNKTLTVERKRLANFEIYPVYQIITEKRLLIPNESTDIVIGCLYQQEEAGKDPMLLAAKEGSKIKGSLYSRLSAESTTKSTWRLAEGDGVLSTLTDKHTTSFKAGATITGDALVTEAELEGLKPIKDTKAPGGVRKIDKITLHSAATQLSEEYILMKYNGKQAVLVKDLEVEYSNNINVGIQAYSGDSLMCRMDVRSLITGEFACGDYRELDYARLILMFYKEESSYNSYHSVCEAAPPKPQVYTTGKIKVTKAAAAIGEFIDGSFKGELYSELNYNDGRCIITPRMIEIDFHLKRRK